MRGIELLVDATRRTIEHEIIAELDKHGILSISTEHSRSAIDTGPVSLVSVCLSLWIYLREENPKFIRHWIIYATNYFLTFHNIFVVIGDDRHSISNIRLLLPTSHTAAVALVSRGRVWIDWKYCCGCAAIDSSGNTCSSVHCVCVCWTFVFHINSNVQIILIRCVSTFSYQHPSAHIALYLAVVSPDTWSYAKCLFLAFWQMPKIPKFLHIRTHTHTRACTSLSVLVFATKIDRALLISWLVGWPVALDDIQCWLFLISEFFMMNPRPKKTLLLQLKLSDQNFANDIDSSPQNTSKNGQSEPPTWKQWKQYL